MLNYRVCIEQQALVGNFAQRILKPNLTCLLDLKPNTAIKFSDRTFSLIQDQ